MYKKVLCFLINFRKRKFLMQTNWNLAHIFQSKEKWFEEKEELKEKIKEHETHLKQLTMDTFKEVLEEKIQIDEQIEKIYCYPKRFLDIDNQDKEHQNMFNEALQIYEKIVKLSQFFEKFILKNIENIQKFVDENPYYNRYLSLYLRKKEFQVENEELFAFLHHEQITFQELYRSLSENDLSFGYVTNEEGKEVHLTKKLYQELLLSEKAEIRKKAYTVYNEAYQKIQNTLAILLNKKYEIEFKQAQAQKFSSILSQKMFFDELPENTIENLIKITNQNLWIFRKFSELKKQVLGLSELHMYDTSLPLGTVSKMKIELPQAIEYAKESLNILGDNYVKRIDEAFKEGWVDVYPKKNKRKMTYSCISYCGVSYASLNYHDNLISARNLVHELGHSIHTSYAKEQGYPYFEYSLFIAEVVAKVNEILFNEYMLTQNLPKEEKVYLLTNIVSALGNSLFNQMLLTEFEDTIIKEKEKNQTLTADTINQIYLQIFSKYNQESVILDDMVKYSWTKIPHLFMNRSYYLYQYTIGTALAIEIADKLKNKNLQQKYLEFLKIGNTKSIIESLKTLDINLENEEYIKSAYQYLNEQIKKLIRILK